MKCPVNKAVTNGYGGRGFTLIELLVVIAIIAVLAAILMPALNSALTKAEKAKAQTELSQIVSAIKTFYGDYGRMPVALADDGVPDKTYGAKNKPNKQKVVMDILRAKDSAGNPKGTIFLDVPRDRMVGTDKDGGTYAETDGYYLDPWGNPYVISVDMNFDGSAFLSGLDSPSAPAATLTVTSFLAVAASYGPDPSSTKSFLTSWGRN